MDALGNDFRFELHYYGRMQQDGREMEEYAYNKGYGNIFFHGAYMPLERYEFAKETDLIHNVYDCGYTTGNAMGNKYYDGIIFGIPQICTEGSHMGNIVNQGGVGLIINLDDYNIGDKIWNYYRQLDWEKFETSCEIELYSVKKQQSTVKSKLTEFIEHNKM